MSAKPIIPGRLYHVRGFGIDVEVIAPSACIAGLIVANQVIPCES